MTNQNQTNFKDPEEMTDEELLEGINQLETEISKQEEFLRASVIKRIANDPELRSGFEEMKKEEEEEKIRNVATATDDRVLNPLQRQTNQTGRGGQETQRIAGLRENSQQSRPTPANPVQERTTPVPNLASALGERQKPELYQAPSVPPERRPYDTGESLKRIREELSRTQSAPEVRTRPENNFIRPNDTTKSPVETAPERAEPVTRPPTEAPARSRLEQSGGSAQAGGRYGIEPARDLGTDDFDWQGEVGGVEIEKNIQEEDGEEGVPDRASILQEIEHPPAYVPKTSLEKKMETNFDPGRPLKEEKPVAEPNIPPKKIEESRQARYRSSDPYREPVDE